MSAQQLIDLAQPPSGKIYNTYLPNPYPFPAQPPTLAQVLLTGNDAGNNDIVNVENFKAVSIGANLIQQPYLEVGVSGDDLRILGATTKGSILVGDGTSTVGLPVGANGLVLTTNSTTATGLEWAVGGGGGGVASVSAGNNITVSGTVSNPIVAVASPLNATLNVATQNITATTGIASFTGASSVANISENGVSAYDAITATTLSTLAKTGLTTATLTDSVSATPTGISKTLGATALSISSTTAPITITPASATDCNVVVDGTGALRITQTSTGGATQPCVEVENTNGGANAVHLDLYKNSSSPATNDGVGAISFHANNASGTKVEYARIQADQRDTTAGSENGSISILTNVNSPTPTEFFRCNGLTNTNELYKFLETRGNYLQNTTAGQSLTLVNSANAGNIVLNNIGASGNITNTCSNGQFSVASNSFSITSTNAGLITATGNLILTSSANVIIPQNSSTTTKLTTEVANVKYYPTFLVDNNNTSSVSIPPPSIMGQRLTLVNKGISPPSTWVNYGNNLNTATGILAVLQASSGNIWVSRKDSGTIEIWDSTITSVVSSVVLTGWAERAYCFYEEGGYMYIGGSFTTVNGNATPQFCIARVNASSYVEDPIYDGASGYNGVDGSVGLDGVYAIHSYSGALYCGGQFTAIIGSSPPTAVANLIYITLYASAGGSQTYNDAYGGTNAKVNALLNAGSYLWVGGDFTLVQVIGGFPIGYQYIAVLNGGVWDYVGGGGGAFNSPVNVIQNYCGYPYIIVGGAFTSPYQYVCHLDYTLPNNFATDTTLSISAPINRNCISYSGVNYIHTTTQGVYYSQTFQVWSNVGTPYLGVPSFMGIWNGEPKVAFEDYVYIQSRTNVSQSASFVLSSGSFKFNTGSYTTASISLPDVGWDFVGDTTGAGIWRQTSYNAWGSYS